MKLELKKEYHESDGKYWLVLYIKDSAGERKEFFSTLNEEVGIKEATARFEELKRYSIAEIRREPELILSYDSEEEEFYKKTFHLPPPLLIPEDKREELLNHLIEKADGSIKLDKLTSIPPNFYDEIQSNE